jgi:hypothetical protein
MRYSFAAFGSFAGQAAPPMLSMGRRWVEI